MEFDAAVWVAWVLRSQEFCLKVLPLTHIWQPPCALYSFVPRLPLLFPAPPDSGLAAVLGGPFLIFSESRMRTLNADTQFKLFIFPFQNALTSSRTASGAWQLESWKCPDATFSISFRYPWLIHPVWANVGFLIAVCLDLNKCPSHRQRVTARFKQHFVLPSTSLSLSDAT